MSNIDPNLNTNSQQTVNQDNPYQQYYQQYLPDFNSSPDVGGVQTGNVRYAGFGIRFLAWLIDSFILFFLSFIIGFVFGLVFSFISFSFFSDDLFNLIASFIGYLLSFVTGLLYFTLFWSSKSQGTPGKILLGLKVVDAKGNQISYTTSLIRYLSTILSSIPLGIGYLLIIFDSKKQALHDKLASTYVIKVKK